MTAHSPIGPSKAARIVQCPYSVTAPADMPDSGDEAAEGTAAHWFASETLLRGAEPTAATDPAGTPIDDDMREAARVYVEHVRSLGSDMRMVEYSVRIRAVHPQCFGTLDHGACRGNVIHVTDFKYGFKPVEAFENLQLASYAAGLLDQIGALDTLMRVSLSIVQPRAPHREGPIRTWNAPATALRPLVNVFSNAAHEALGPSPRARAGVECAYCPARLSCGTFAAASADVCDRAGQPSLLDMTPAAVGVELRALDRAARLLEARQAVLRERAEFLLRGGSQVPHYKLDRSPGRLAWLGKPAEVLALGRLAGVDLAKPAEPITPTQALDRKLLPAEVVKAYAQRPAGAVKLVADDGSLARRVFGS